jgi:hypothetical protein
LNKQKTNIGYDMDEIPDEDYDDYAIDYNQISINFDDDV